MTLWSARTARALRRLAAAVLVGGLCLPGCAQKQPSAPGEQAQNEQPPQPAAKAPDPGAVPAPAAPASPGKRDPLHQAFADATRPADNPPAESNRPPDETISKKSVYKLLEDVAARWDAVRFTTAGGKKIAYSASVETSVGNFRIELFPELAPNHVRNFIALAQAGYYDQLLFERVRQEGEGQRALRAVEAGCPLGSGELGDGSIGYWLKDEFTPPDKMSHDEGTVGACHGAEADTAACRFYITLSKAPSLDGNYTIFGKVVQGLDVVRTIYTQPVIVDDRERDGARHPEKPAVILKVTIHKTEP